MRYGSAKAGAGAGVDGGGSPEVDAKTDGVVSPSVGLGEDVGLVASDGEGIVVGGGSIAECGNGGLEGMTGSGSKAMASSEEDVSIVICVVDLDVGR